MLDATHLQIRVDWKWSTHSAWKIVSAGMEWWVSVAENGGAKRDGAIKLLTLRLHAALLRYKIQSTSTNEINIKYTSSK